MLCPRPPVKQLLHVFPSFGIGGLPLRMCRIINHLGESLSHTFIALDGDCEARYALSSDLDIKFLTPRKVGVVRAIFRNAATLHRLRPDLLITYNWGSIEWAIAHRIISNGNHIHFEAGFGKEEAEGQLKRRVLCRRWALARCSKVIVPSRLLEEVALKTWGVPLTSLIYIPNGVDVCRFWAPPPDARSTCTRRSGELVIGTVAPLRPEKNIGRLLEAFARVRSAAPARLVVAGEGSERASLQSRAEALGISDRVTFTGWSKPEAVLRTFDIFALSSDTEQMPNALLEAMAASLPVAAVDVGDVSSMLSEENRPFVVAKNANALGTAFEVLLQDASLRQKLAQANHHRALTLFSLDTMLARYSELFAAVLLRGAS